MNEPNEKPARPRSRPRFAWSRIRRVVLWTAGVLVGAPVLILLLVLIALNVDPGRRLVERLAGQLTANQVVITGLGGRFPDALTLAHAKVRDADGAWLLLDGIVLDWSPSRLLSGEARVDRLEADRVQVPRLPQSTAPAQPTAASSQPFSLPVRVAVEHLHVARAEIGAPVAGVAAALSLTGSAHLASLQDGDVAAVLDRLDSPGHYAVSGHVDPATLAATLKLNEPGGGLIAAIAKLPALGAITADATIGGPRAAEATDVAITAGPLRATANGRVDLVHSAANLDVTADAPAMAPADGIAWQSVALSAHVAGPFTRPDATGQLRIAGLQAAGAGFTTLSADLNGNQGAAGLRATIDGLRIPGPKPDLFAASPVTLQADARLDDPARPVTFSLAHPLLTAHGTARTAGDISVHADLAAPDLAPLAAAGGVDLRGRTQLAVQADLAGGTTRVAVDGTLGITGGLTPVPGLLGDAAKIGVTVALAGPDITVERAQVDGRAITLAAHGTDRGNVLDLAYAVGLPDLAVLSPAVAGSLKVDGTATGPTDNLTLALDLAGDIGTRQVARGPIKASVHATGLPGQPAGSVVAQGTLEGAPLDLSVHATRAADGTLQAVIDQAAWKSLHADGSGSLAAGASLPQGHVSLRMTRLEDLAPLVGQPVTGSVTAEAVVDGPTAKLDLQATHAGLPGNAVGRAVLAARVTGLPASPVVAATLDADGIAAAGIGGGAKLSVTGPQDALAIRLNAALSNLAGADATVAAAATLDVPAKRVQVASLQTVWHGETLRLLAPVRVSFGDGVSVDRLRIGLQQAVLDLAGRLTPRLDLTASLRGVTPDLARPFAPDVNADGALTAEAKLTGTPADPAGTVKLQATGLRMRTGPARGLPPANLTATAQLAGHAATVDARLTAGASRLGLTGKAPLGTGLGAGALALQANGAIDLALLEPILAAQGRQLRGRVTLDARVTGSTAAPQVNGTAVLAGGEVQDFAQGVRIRDIAATIQAAGETIRLASLTGKAGPGTISASGTAGLRAPMPVDLKLTMRNARPLQSDRLTAELNADLTVTGAMQTGAMQTGAMQTGAMQTGAMQTGLAAAGHVDIVRAEINIPEHLPSSIAVLNVRIAGQKPPPPSPPAAPVRLDLTIDTTGQIFVRGRGLDAELGGRLKVGGTTAAPVLSGGFVMRRGTFSLAGTTLNFVRGKVSFEGAGVTDKIDPSLDFEADSATSNVTAMLLVGGFASAPKITLASNPPLPQDEVLAQLLFGRSAKDLGPFQYAEIASALADLSGNGTGLNPLDRVRKGLGLDRLSVGAGATNSSASIEAGRYIANGVYLGAKQGTSGAQTQATVQVDLLKGLKAETDVGAGQGANSVGLTYQFEY